MLMIKKIELNDLNENIVGKYITDSNKTSFYKLLKRYEGELNYEVLLENGFAIDEEILLRDWYVLEEV